jgi:hypothetical protein
MTGGELTLDEMNLTPMGQVQDVLVEEEVLLSQLLCLALDSRDLVEDGSETFLLGGDLAEQGRAKAGNRNQRCKVSLGRQGTLRERWRRT